MVLVEEAGLEGAGNPDEGVAAHPGCEGGSVGLVRSVLGHDLQPPFGPLPLFEGQVPLSLVLILHDLGLEAVPDLGQVVALQLEPVLPGDDDLVRLVLELWGVGAGDLAPCCGCAGSLRWGEGDVLKSDDGGLGGLVVVGGRRVRSVLPLASPTCNGVISGVNSAVVLG